jgi:hypothetical protein
MTALYLDTELTDVTLSYVARVCAASPYSKRELERIMFSEVLTCSRLFGPFET